MKVYSQGTEMPSFSPDSMAPSDTSEQDPTIDEVD